MRLIWPWQDRERGLSWLKAGTFALMFAPAITRKAVHRRLIDELLDLVGGSQPLLAHLVDSGKLSVDDLKAIEKRVRK